MLLQVIAYNKIDLPDSGDYIEEVREFLLGNGLAEEDVHAISAVTGQGVQGIVRRARQVLDQLPQEASTISHAQLYTDWLVKLVSQLQLGLW